jgi:hypothetical protein
MYPRNFASANCQQGQRPALLVDFASPEGVVLLVCPASISRDHRPGRSASFECHFLVEKIMTLHIRLPVVILFSLLGLILA